MRNHISFILNQKSAIRNLTSAILFAGLLVAFCPVAEAQQPKHVARIGLLLGATSSATSNRLRAFSQGMRELGYVEGKNIVIEPRYADGKLERLPELAMELVHLNVDVIVTGGQTPTRAAKSATDKIPIVMANDRDPVGEGFVTSLARPGGNITGLTNFAGELSGKRLELLKEIIPTLSRVAVLGTSTVPGNVQALKETELADGVQSAGSLPRYNSFRQYRDRISTHE